MAVVYSENSAHRAVLQAAEHTRQVAIAAASGNAAAIKAADIAYFRSAKASALANNCGVTQFMDALRELGTGGT